MKQFKDSILAIFILTGIIGGIMLAAQLVENSAESQTLPNPPNHKVEIPVILLSPKDLTQDKVNPFVKHVGKSAISPAVDGDYIIVIRALNMKLYAHPGYRAEKQPDGTIKDKYVVTLMALSKSVLFNFNLGDEMDADEFWIKMHKFALKHNWDGGPG